MVLNDYAKAIEQFEKAVEANPDVPTGYDALGHASALNGDPDRGKAMLKQGDRIGSGVRASIRPPGPAVLHAAQLGIGDGEFQHRRLSLGLKNEEYFYELGLAYSYLDDCPNGIKWFEKALELNPDSKPAQDRDPTV